MALLPAELNKVDPSEAWKPWTPSADEPWDRKRAAHLYRRATFGAAPTDIDKALSAGFSKTLDKLLIGESKGGEFTEEYRESAESVILEKGEPDPMRAWWLYWMVLSPHPLREKLTLFWHNHFATSYAKIRSVALMFEQNLTIRKHALGKFRPFLLDMSKDTAMLIWLDSNRNVKGAPNENFAREVMELFSLGVGNYTEKDIQEAARAFTGWHHNITLTAFENNPTSHDDGQKTVLGKKGAWTGSDIVRICCDQPACAKFVVGKLYAFLVSEAPPPKGLLTPLEERFRKSDYNIADLAAAILGSRFFFSTHAYRKRVKWPVEYVLEAFHAVTPGMVPPLDFVAPLAKMGQVLFSPPNVKGWRTGTDWLNSATLLARNNFAEVVALGEWRRQGERPTGGAAVEPSPPEPEAAPMIAFAEAASLAIAGGAGTAALTSTIPLSDAPDGKKYLLLQNTRAGKPASKSGKSSAPPPAPPAKVDPIVTIYASKPKDIPALAARMSELLYGERMPAAQIAKIEKFLHEPLTAPKSADTQPKQDPRKKSAASEAVKTAPQPPQAAVEEVKDPKKPATLNMDSPEFKARVREALHAMMCLPEYQLN